MTLCETGKFFGSDVTHVSFINYARRDMPGSDQISQPCGGVGVVFVVIGEGHAGGLYVLRASVARSSINSISN